MSIPEMSAALRYINMESARLLSLKDVERLLPEYERLPMPVSGAMLESIENLRAVVTAKRAKALKRSRRDKGAGLVYIIASPLGYKIGITRAGVKSRLRNIRTANPTATVYHTIPCEQPEIVETALHNYFADYHTNGEFYNLPDDVLEDLREIHGELSALMYCGVI